MSISTMPSAPNAEEIATSLPNVSNAQASTCCGLQLSAVNCSSAILFFMPSAPHLAEAAPARETFRKVRRKAKSPLPSKGVASQTPLLRPDRPDPRPHRQSAAWARQVAAHDADQAK